MDFDYFNVNCLEWTFLYTFGILLHCSNCCDY